MTDATDLKAQLDERKIARGVAIGVPVVTITTAAAVGVVLGVPMAILVLAAGTLLGVIALLWASIRILSGDAALPPEIEALDAAAHGIDALSSRKTMLVRALKDLDNEHSLGKLEDDDFEQIASTYRGELKEVMRRIDASLEPFREKAEAAARAHLAESAGGADSRGEQPAKANAEEPARADERATSRVPCAKCGASNEADAKFCKGCAAVLGATTNAKKKESADEG